MKTFTLSQIRKAYWAQFHKAGELWFDYLGSSTENWESTHNKWQEFVRYLLDTNNVQGATLPLVLKAKLNK